MINIDTDVFKYGILIGGLSISRGLTIKGLRISYFDRKITLSDTGVQSMRFTGYHTNRDLIRVFMTSKIKEQFEKMTSDLFCTKMQLINHEDSSSLKLSVALWEGLKPTGKNSNIKKNVPKPFGKVKECGVFELETVTHQDTAVHNLINESINVGENGEIIEFNIENGTGNKDEKNNIIFRDMPIHLFINFLNGYYFPVEARSNEYDKQILLQQISKLGEEVKMFDLIIINVSKSYKGRIPKNVFLGKIGNIGASNQRLIPIASFSSGNMNSKNKLRISNGRVISNSDKFIGLTMEEVYYAKALYIWHNKMALNNNEINIEDYRRQLEVLKNMYNNSVDKYMLSREVNEEYNKLMKHIKSIDKAYKGKMTLDVKEDMFRLARTKIRLFIKLFNPDLATVKLDIADREAFYACSIITPFVKSEPDIKGEYTQLVTR